MPVIWQSYGDILKFLFHGDIFWLEQRSAGVSILGWFVVGTGTILSAVLNFTK